MEISSSSESGHETGTHQGVEVVPIPSLGSLLLSTAESLAARSSTSQLSPTSPRKAALPTSGHVLAGKAIAPGTGGKKLAASAELSQGFPKGVTLPATPSSLLSAPESKEYLSTLVALPLPALQCLPTSLAQLSSTLDTDLSTLAYARYSSFLLSHAANDAISSSFTTLSTELGSLLSSTSALETAAGAFESRVHDVRRKRERMARVKERMEEVEEILETPQVVDGCVRAGYWGEAIDVASRVQELYTKLQKRSRILLIDNEGDKAQPKANERGALLLLGRVQEEVALALLSLRSRVLESLLDRGLKLPAAVRAIGVLKRMNGESNRFAEPLMEPRKIGRQNVISEETLSLIFLTSRWRCLRMELETVESEMAAIGIVVSSKNAKHDLGAYSREEVTSEENEERTRWVKRWIELWRELVGETIGMYCELFLSSKVATSDDGTMDIKEAINFSTASLDQFLSSALSSITSMLKSAVPVLTSVASLSSLLMQISYCSNSFARYGLEFRDSQLIRQTFEDRVGQVVMQEWQAAGQHWEKEWRDGWNMQSTRQGKERQTLSDWLVAPESLSTLLATPLPPSSSSGKGPATSPSSWHHQPPPSLALLPPLARFLNTHASALNSLRLLPATSLYAPLHEAQAREMDRSMQVLEAFTEAWLQYVDTTAGSTPILGYGEELSREEKAREAKKVEERKIIIFTIAAFARWVIPWCEGGLTMGVYGEVFNDFSITTHADSGQKKLVLQDLSVRANSLMQRLEEPELTSKEIQDESQPDRTGISPSTA